MNQRILVFALSSLFLTLPASAQLPARPKLSPQDEAEFNQELARLNGLLRTANNKPAIELQIANTYAAAGEYAEALRRLREVVNASFGFDPSRDPDFASVRNTAEFQSIMDQVRRDTPPINNSRLFATLQAGGVRPENIAYDSQRNAFLLGDTTKLRITRCSATGVCSTFVSPDAKESGYVLGLKVNQPRNELWTTVNTASGSGLRCFELEKRQLMRLASIQGKHVFNDLVISPNRSVYVTDTQEGAVYELPSNSTALRKIAPQHVFTSANGIALSPNQNSLYVSTWENGIESVNLQSGAVTPMPHPPDICLAFVDGLYSIKGGLIAIQNGPMLPRIVKFALSNDGQKIVGMSVLERRNPAFDGITTGAIVGTKLYYVANPQVDSKIPAQHQPLKVLSLQVDR